MGATIALQQAELALARQAAMTLNAELEKAIRHGSALSTEVDRLTARIAALEADGGVVTEYAIRPAVRDPLIPTTNRATALARLDDARDVEPDAYLVARIVRRSDWHPVPDDGGGDAR